MKKFLLIFLLLPTLVFGQFSGPTSTQVADGEGAATLVWLGTPSNSSESVANIRPGDTIVMGIKIHNYKNNNAITYAHIDVQYDKRMYTKINHVFHTSANGTSHFIGDNRKMSFTNNHPHYDIWMQWSQGGSYPTDSNFWIDHYQASSNNNNLASLDWYVKINLLVKDYDSNLDYTDGIVVTMGRMTESNNTVYDPMYAYEYQDFTYTPVQAAPSFVSSVDDGQDAIIYKSFKINDYASNNNQSEYNAHPANASDFDNMFDYANKKTTEWTHYGRETATKAFTWPSSKLPRHNSNNFGWEIEAKFVPEETGTYTFELDSDDRSDLFFDTNGDGNMTNTNLAYNNGKRTVDISLTADNVYSFRVRYEQGVGGADLYLKWKRPSDSDYQFNKDEIWSVSPASIPHKLDVVYNLNTDLDKSKFSSKLEYDNGTVNGTKTESLGTSGQVSYNDDGGGVYSTQVNTGNKKATTTGGSVEWCVIYAYDNTNNRYRVGIDSREFTNQQPDWDKVTKLKLFDLWDGAVTPKSGNNNADTHWNEYWIYTDTELDFSNSTFSSYIRSMGGGGYGIKAEFEFVDVTSYINHDLLLEVDNTYYSDQYANVITVQDLALAFSHLTSPGSGGPFGGSGGIYTTGIEYVVSDVNEDNKFDFTDTQLMMQHIYGDTDPFEGNAFDDVVLLFESDYNSWSTSDWSTSVPRGKTKTYVPSTSFSQRTQSKTYNMAILGDVNFSHSKQPTNYTTNSAQETSMDVRYSSAPTFNRTDSSIVFDINRIENEITLELSIPSNQKNIVGSQFKIYFDKDRVEYNETEFSSEVIPNFATGRSNYVTVGSFTSEDSQNLNNGITYRLKFKLKSNLQSTLGLFGIRFMELVDKDNEKIELKIK